MRIVLRVAIVACLEVPIHTNTAILYSIWRAGDVLDSTLTSTHRNLPSSHTGFRNDHFITCIHIDENFSCSVSVCQANTFFQKPCSQKTTLCIHFSARILCSHQLAHFSAFFLLLLYTHSCHQPSAFYFSFLGLTLPYHLRFLVFAWFPSVMT